MGQKTGFIFPGQGSQFVGMGKSLADSHESAKNIFRKADEVLGYSISKICFEGPEETLMNTLNAQPAIYVTSFVAYTVLRETIPALKPDLVAGHSLGEFSALAAAGFFSFEDGLRLVQVRAKAMEKAASENPGTMAAILGLEQADCIAISKESGAEVANFNAPIQTVLTGTAEAINKACDIAEAKGAKRAVKLNVSGAFHSTLMKQAQSDLVEAIDKIQTHPLQSEFIPNVLGELVSDDAQIRDLLGQQLVSSVCWTKTMRSFTESAVESVVEVGPGKVLKGLGRNCGLPCPVQVFGTNEDVELIKKFFEGVTHA